MMFSMPSNCDARHVEENVFFKACMKLGLQREETYKIMSFGDENHSCLNTSGWFSPFKDG
jgi:hypothetical protein